ncbi:MAG: calcium-binding protein, partial [Gammaproteobacteria bacterium]|nr:calcium-binding protein [Gammaproteobacteria bacterium]
MGDVDRIEGGAGNDRIFGGAAGDVISDAGGDNTVFGDHGEIDGSDRRTTDLTGGSDLITTGGGNDVIFGGALGDRVSSSGGNNIVFGDFGEVAGSLMRTTDPDGGSDVITTGGGNDVIFGGALGDRVSSSGGN